MTPRTRSRIVLAVLAIAAVSGLWRATSVEREKRRLAAAYQEAKALVDQLSQERTKLSEELTGAHQTVEGQSANLTQLQEELDRVQRQLEDTVQELAALDQQHQALRTEHQSMASALSAVQQDKQQLEAKLSDIRQLKLAIRDVRNKIWDRRFVALRTRWHERVEAREREDQEQLASGNRGYVLREGMTTIGKAPRLHIHVLEPRAE